MTATGYAHIEMKPDGTPIIAGTRINVMRIAMDHTRHGQTAEEIAFEYEGLTLGQVFGALAYYYDHKQEVDSLIDEHNRERAVHRAEHAGTHAETLRRLAAKGVRR